jgi:CheY-like chemotaxis protein/anti-sigma regulatory factor (Ser/Thr protein kinase)
VVWNLVANAVKFTPRGGDVNVELREHEGLVEIAVVDTGVGIKPEFQPHLFERFQQADGSITRSFGGLGLGLSIVRHIVELHGGTVSASSEGEGRGAQFVVRLSPQASASVPGMMPSLADNAAPTGSDTLDLAGKRVLVVDDDPDARDLLQRILEDAGAQVQVAASAEAGLELARQQAPDVLLSDISMPGTDGYQFLRLVRELLDEPGRSMPAIALTAFARDEDRERSLKAGFAMHISKPMDPTEVVGAVGKVLALSAAADGAARQE